MNEIEKRVLDAINFDEMLTYLCDLIAIKSLDGEETPAQESVAQQMEACGLDLDVWNLDFAELEKHPAYCVEVERPQALGVVGALGTDTGGRHLILNGHTDVVPAGDLANWQYPAWEGTVTEDRVYGRGSTDMKGGLCCALFAAKAIRDAGVTLKGKVMIESVVGEEDGGVGTLATVLRGYKADGAIIMEPTELIVAPAQAGALNFRITIPGLSAHGCVRDEGVSAIEKFFPIYQALMVLEKEVNQQFQNPLYADHTLPYPLCVGTINAGTWASSVAESLHFEGRFGVGIGADVGAMRSRFESVLMEAVQQDPWLKDHPPKLEWWGGQFEPASIPVDHPIVQTVVESANAFQNSTTKVAGMTYGADMRLLVNEGQTPTVMFGPGDVRDAHRPDEFVPIADLEIVTKTLALTILRFCDYELS
ncbi:MAG: ArgE/DapE family deacylase [Chloroflexota bacterium]